MKTKENDYPLINLLDITDEARQIAVRWVEGYEPSGFDIQGKQKLASDIMNYARRTVEQLWVNSNMLNPTHNGVYTVFGTRNLGTPHERKEQWTAYWYGEQYWWGDKEGEALVEDYELIEYWLDLSKIPDPTK